MGETSRDGIRIEEQGTATFTDSIAIRSISEPGIDGLDELAAELGVEEGDAGGIGLEARSGRYFDLVALLAAHLQEMRRSRG